MAFDFFGDKTRAVVAIKPLQGGGAAGIELHCITTNTVSRISENVLRRFLDPTPFPTSSDTDGARL